MKIIGTIIHWFKIQESKYLKEKEKNKLKKEYKDFKKFTKNQ